MILFCACSLILFFLYVGTLTIIDPINAGYMLGITLDIPLLVAVTTAIRLKNTPFAVLITAISVLVTAEIIDANQMYKQHAIISQIFICIVVSRVHAIFKKGSMVDDFGDNNWLYDKLNVKALNWRWKERCNQLVNRSSLLLNKISLGIVFVTVVVIGISGLELISALPVVVMGYTALWLGFFALYVTPVLLLERAGRFIYSFKNSPARDTLRSNTENSVNASKQKLKDTSEKTKSWIKDGFEEG